MPKSLKDRNQAHEYDVIVVGTGLCGAAAADTLASAGLKVLVIDAGPVLTSAAFRRKPPVKNLFSPRHQLFRLKLLLQGDHAGAFNKFFDEQTEALYVKEKAQPFATPPSRGFSWWRVRTVGGRGHLWGRVMLRLSDESIHQPGYEWPLSVSELTEHYTHIEMCLELGGAIENHPEVEDGQYMHERTLGTHEQTFRAAVERRWPTRRVLVNRVAQYDPGPLSPLMTRAMSTGRTTIRPQTVVARLAEDEHGAIVGVECIDTATGSRDTCRAPNVVLAASPFETVRLLLNSTSKLHPQGIGNSAGLLGTRILEHITASAMFELPKKSRSNAPRLMPYAFKLNEEPQGFYLPSFALAEHLGLAHGFGIQGIFSQGSGLCYIGTFGETVPNDRNRLTLHKTMIDEWGIPSAHIDFDWSPDDLRSFEAAKIALDELLAEFESASGFKVKRPVTTQVYNLHTASRPTPGSNHECGGARMGTDPKTSVTNSFGALWDAPNVILADASVFPSLPDRNPTLTSMALARRACTELANRLVAG